MGPHEVVNGANGSVTWCQGPPFCPNCVQGPRACERVGTVLPLNTSAITPGYVVWPSTSVTREPALGDIAAGFH